MKKIVLLIILLMYASEVNSQKLYEDYSRAFGIKASNISGYGAYMRQNITSDLKVQLTGIYYMLSLDNENEVRDLNGYTIGAELQGDMYHFNSSRMYLIGGGYYFHDKDDVKNVSFKETSSWNIGVGSGYEYYFHRVSVGLEIGVKYYIDNGTKIDAHRNKRYFKQTTTKIGLGTTIGFIF